MPRRVTPRLSKRRLAVGLLALLLTLWLPPQGRGQDTPALAPSGDLAPSVQSFLDTESKRCVKLRARLAGEEMEKVIESLRSEHGLDEAAVARLKEAGAKAAGDSLESWEKDFHSYRVAAAKRFQRKHGLPAELFVLRLFDRGDAEVLKTFRAPEEARPQSRPEWIKVLTEVLTEAQLADWKAGVADEIAARDRRIDAFLDDLIESRKAEQPKNRAAQLATLKSVVKPEPALAAKLDSLAGRADAAILERLRVSARYFLARADSSLWPVSAKLALPAPLAQSPEWKAGLETLLTPEQLGAWRKHLDREEKDETARLTAILRASELKARPAAREQMRAQLNLLFKAVELNQATEKKFTAASAEAVEQSLADWRKNWLRLLRQMSPRDRNAAVESGILTFSSSNDRDGPKVQKAWTSAIDTLLSAGQKATWQAEEAINREREAKRLTEMIDATAMSFLPQLEFALAPRLLEVISTLNLNDKQILAFREAGKKAVEQSVAVWKTEAREWLAGLSPTQRENYLLQGRIPFRFDRESATQSEAWTTAFGRILTPGEMARWEKIGKDRDQRALDAVAGMLLLIMDDWVGIDAGQWPALTEICRAGSADLTSRFEQQHFYINMIDIGKALKKIPGDRVREVLDDSQWQRWSESIDMIERQFRPRTTAKEPGDLPPGPDEEVVEQLITRLIHQRKREKRRELLLLLRADIETMKRASHLPPGKVTRLQTAAKGAAEEAAGQWVVNYVKYARVQTKGANPKRAQLKLGALPNYGGNQKDPRLSPVWIQAFPPLLDQTQAKAWREASAERDAHRRDAVAALLTSAFIPRFGLGDEQARDFHDKVRSSLDTYGPDIEKLFPNRNTRWYLRQQSMAVAIMAIPRNELETLLTEEQLHLWDTRFQKQAANYWKSVVNYHRQRLQSEK